MFWKEDMVFWKDVWDLKVDDNIVTVVENHFNRKLPKSFIEIYKQQNGGKPARRCYPTQYPNLWADDFVEIDDFWPLQGRSNIIDKNDIYVKNWDFPDIGIYFASDMTEGDGAFALDYSIVGDGEEPKVSYVYLDGCVFMTILVANSFDEFMLGLKKRKEFDK